MARPRDYILMLDTETANTIDANGKLDMSDVLCYDIGWIVTDRHGNIYQTRSFVNRDIFVYERELMRTAYYARKIPQYISDIRAGTRIMADLYTIRQTMLGDIANYKIKYVCAHNSRFDNNALQRTQSYITKARYRYWFAFDSVIWWDSLRMARSLIAKKPNYIKFCTKNNYLTKTGKPQLTAEVLYRFITKDNSFKESHTGLEDVLIEKEIMTYCFRQHKPFDKELYTSKREFPPMTDFQKNFWISLKETPRLRI